jgi:hypothetical protein
MSSHAYQMDCIEAGAFNGTPGIWLKTRGVSPWRFKPMSEIAEVVFDGDRSQETDIGRADTLEAPAVVDPILDDEREASPIRRRGRPPKQPRN